MLLNQFLFYLFSSLAIVSGLMVIQSRNPVYSVLFLILVFLNAAGLLVLLGLDFFAFIFLVVYVGAIAVLFLFVVMMLNIKLTQMRDSALSYLPVGAFIGLIFLFEVLLVVDQDLLPFPHLDESLARPDWVNWSHLVHEVNSLEALGQLMYTYYFYYFLMASLILLVAMIGAIMLTLHKSPDVRRQDIFEQNARDFAQTVQKVRG